MHATSARQPARAAIFANLFAVYLIWGSTYLAIRYAVAGAPPFVAMGARFLVAGGLLYVVLRLRRVPRPTFAQWRAGAIIGVLLLLCGNGMVAWAEAQGVASSLAALLVSMTPIWMALIDWLRPHGHRPPWGVVAGLLLGFGGVALLVGPNVMRDLHANHPSWALLIVPFGALAWALGSIYARGAPVPASSLMGTSIEMICGGVALALVALVTGEVGQINAHLFTFSSTSALIYLIIFGSLVGYSAYTWLLQKTPLALVSTYAYVNPVVAVFLGWAIASETLTPLTLVAAATIIVSVCIITTFRGRASASAPEPALIEDPQGASVEMAE